MGANSSPAAKLERAVKRYGATTALDGIDLSIERGQVTALLGPNGAGKSTAISLLLGLIAPDSGQVALFGEPPQSLTARQRVGMMLQSAALPDTLRVGELLQLVAGYYPRARPLRATAKLANIQELLDRPYGKLSGGQQRRVQFALAICGNPELLFLDEPTTGLDIEARESVWSVVRELVSQGCSVLLTTHYLEEAEALANQVTVLMRGQIAIAGPVDKVRLQGTCRHIRCRTTLRAEKVMQWAGVRGASQDDRWLDVEAQVAEPIVRRLLDADPHLTELEVRRAGLAEAFAHITKEVVS